MKINNSFDQINAYWCEQRELEKQKELQELKELELLLNQYEDNVELENALFNTNEIVSTKFGTNVNNIDTALQIDSAQIFIPQEKQTENIITDEIDLQGIKFEDIEERLIENETELNISIDIPTKFVVNKLENMIKYEVREDERDLSNIKQTEEKIIPQIKQEKEETNFNFQKQNIFKKRKFSQTNMNNIVTEFHKRSKGKFKILKFYKKDHQKDHSNLINSIETLKNIVTETFSMNLR